MVTRNRNTVPFARLANTRDCSQSESRADPFEMPPIGVRAARKNGSGPVRGLGMSGVLVVDVLDGPIEAADGHTAELEVGAQARRVRQDRRWVEAAPGRGTKRDAMEPCLVRYPLRQ